MARGEGEPGIKSHFVERVVKLPVVHVAWGYATNTYSHLKESNKLVNFTLTNAEKSVTFVAEQAKPVVLKFEKQIQVVDDLACKGLGTLEEKVPFITKPAEEILGDTRKLYNSTVHSSVESIRKYGTDRVKSVTDYGLDKANAIFGNRLVQSMLTTVDGALVVTDRFIDHLLPPSDDEKKKDGQENSKEVTPLVRLLHISNKLRLRAYNTLSVKLESAQERSIEILLVYPLQLIEFSKEHGERVVQYLSQIWESFKEAGSDETDGEKKTALNVAKEKALWVVGMLRLVPTLLPTYIYAFVSWLESKKTDEHDEHSEKQNGVARNCANANCNSHKSGGRAE
ncbi:perilipin-3-like [Uloborus diversus]|uniref:perilipin-3-like n=1 Tax=Uloborus diversus TaxID=327109 RepID=UPI0024097BB7|nr:perilipin-3-like [Uloborus diversus]XP_054721143.1 perilipin-3-like [Uloborus diversus]XP_054721152.1 perilipin-3-like [Uloborus diversus]XP_054721161.1 perilipin-3-like [Uloborus diversus]